MRIDAAVTQLTDLGDRQHEIESEPPPLFEGLSVDGRRAVNLAVIAYAEAMHDHIAAVGLADLVRQSTLRRVHETAYGGREECLALMQRARRLIAELDYMQDDLADLKARTDRLRATAALPHRRRHHPASRDAAKRIVRAARGILGRLQGAAAQSGQGVGG